jgi:hypothetical protein
MNTTDTSKISTLLNSPVFKAAAAAADAQRMAAHQTAVDELLTHEADTAELTAAQDEAEAARRELQPIEAAYFTARQKQAAASADVLRITTRHELRSNKLRGEAAKHLPEVMARTEHALYFVEAEIRGSFNVKEWREPTLMGYRTMCSDNGAEMGAALEQAGKVRAELARLAIEPTPTDEIIKRLSAEAAVLIDLAKAAGALVALHLPEEIRAGAHAEKPERKPRQFVIQR